MTSAVSRHKPESLATENIMSDRDHKAEAGNAADVRSEDQYEEDDSEFDDYVEVSDSEKTPITIVTGFLGAGKTTLVNYILKEQRQWKIAVIENEFGQVSIDDDLVGENLAAAEDIITMDNGCVCCTVRGDLVRTLGTLVERRKEFDAIILETTGLADPAPIIFTFNSNPMVADSFRIDSVLCLVDAKHINIHLDEKKPDGNINEAEQQVAFADRILLNKLDLVTQEELEDVEDRIKSINSFADIIRTENSRAPLDRILGLSSFSLEHTLEVDPEFMTNHEDVESKAHEHSHSHSHDGHDDCDGCGHDHNHAHEHEHSHDRQDACSDSCHDHDHEHAHEHTHGKHNLDDSAVNTDSAPAKRPRHNLSLVTSVGFSTSDALDVERFNMFMGRLLSEKARDIYRSKGVLYFGGHPDVKYVFQGVHEQINFGPSEVGWKEGHPKTNKLVFIGKSLDVPALQEGLKRCAVDPERVQITVHHRA